MGKRILRTTALSLALLMTLSVCGAFARSGALERSLLRVHIRGSRATRAEAIAESLTQRLGQALAGAENLAQAQQWAAAHLPDIEQWVREAAGQAERTVRAALTRTAAPGKEYAGFSLPAGVYEALEITLGAGEGESFWCIAFPGLCTGEAINCPGWVRGVLTGEGPKGLRFRLMDAFGRVKGYFWKK